MKHLIIPVILSGIIWPGTGQLYNRDFRKGITIIALTALLVISFMMRISPLLKEKLPDKEGVVDFAAARHLSEEILKDSPKQFRTFNLLMTAVWIFSIIDAYLGAKTRLLKGPPKKPEDINTEQ